MEVVAEIGEASLNIYANERRIANLAKDKVKVERGKRGWKVTLYHPHDNEPSYLHVDQVITYPRDDPKDKYRDELIEEKIQKKELEEARK